MSRRRRRRNRNRRSNGTNRWLIGVQILGLSAVLVFLFVFRDYVSKTASQVVTGLGSKDLKVRKKKSENAPGLAPDGPDAGPSENDSKPDASTPSTPPK
jgi:hypothetical protein